MFPLSREARKLLKSWIRRAGKINYFSYTRTCKGFFFSNPKIDITRLSIKNAGKGAINAMYVPDLKCVGADKVNVHACMRITIIYSVTL